jgi:hypothetical protein
MHPLDPEMKRGAGQGTPNFIANIQLCKTISTEQISQPIGIASFSQRSLFSAREKSAGRRPSFLTLSSALIEHGQAVLS